jgi:N-acylglucosamine 2-epimerase
MAVDIHLHMPRVISPSPTTMISLKDLSSFYRDHLFNSVLPFWTSHAIDGGGGINTCIRDDGRVINRDKWLWSQWRAVWVFSHLYNEFGQDPKWLDYAKHIYKFVVQHGWDENYIGWRLCVGHDGKELRGCESIYVDAFAIYGLAEYAHASGDQEPLMLARRTADAVIGRLELPHDRVPHFPYEVPKGTRVHGIPMMFSLVLWELSRLTDHERYAQVAAALSREVMTSFYRPGRDAILERIASNGCEFPPPIGTAVVPGHVIESMWFQIHIARARGDKDTITQACHLIRRNLELGWDSKHGGLFLAIDIDGGDEIAWDYADTKLWWPQTEAMYAMLLAYELTGERWCLDWHERIHDYSFSHYPVPGFGEWTQKLDRQGRPITDIVALPVKDPFHLPRALMYAIESLDRITGRRDD